MTDFWFLFPPPSVVVEASLKSILSLCKSASLSVTLHRYIIICSSNACGWVFAHREVINPFAFKLVAYTLSIEKCMLLSLTTTQNRLVEGGTTHLFFHVDAGPMLFYIFFGC